MVQFYGTKTGMAYVMQTTVMLNHDCSHAYIWGKYVPSKSDGTSVRASFCTAQK
jgi:hypothetical protein